MHAASRRAGGTTAVVAIDLDAFKKFNDDNGHAAGDQLLRDLVACWSTCLREGDLLARVGGDEFALVLPNANEDDARTVLARMRGAFRPCWSTGSSMWGDGETLWEALSSADDELYRAKRERNDS